MCSDASTPHGPTRALHGCRKVAGRRFGILTAHLRASRATPPLAARMSFGPDSATNFGSSTKIQCRMIVMSFRTSEADDNALAVGPTKGLLTQMLDRPMMDKKPVVTLARRKARVCRIGMSSISETCARQLLQPTAAELMPDGRPDVDSTPEENGGANVGHCLA